MGLLGYYTRYFSRLRNNLFRLKTLLPTHHSERLLKDGGSTHLPMRDQTNISADAGAPNSWPLPSSEPELNDEQTRLVDLIMQGHNVFYTGSAGSGKSTVLHAFVRKLAEAGKKVWVLAPTGRAALNVGGTTTWFYAGWVPTSQRMPLDDLKLVAHRNTLIKDRFRKTDVLVIDEVSMIDGFHFKRLDQVMRFVGRNQFISDEVRPFGGCQIVVTGDFCQLPPVNPLQYCVACGKELQIRACPQKRKPVYECADHGEWTEEDKWAFNSETWEDCSFKHIYLTSIHRQRDAKFISILQKCRLGQKLSKAEIDCLMDHPCDVSGATKLLCTRKETDLVNHVEFNKIQQETYVYWAQDYFKWDRKKDPQLGNKGIRKPWPETWQQELTPPLNKLPLASLAEHRFSPVLRLKIGTLVVLLTNLDLQGGLCNGTQGIVCGFVNEEFKDVDPQSLKKRYTDIQINEMKEFMTSDCTPRKMWPVVRFHNGVTRTIYAECSISKLGDQKSHSQLARTQIPLAHAWAMTVHKSQGLTMDKVIVYLDDAFENGQVYVALSRAKSLHGLKVLGNRKLLNEKIMVDSEVTAFLQGKFSNVLQPHSSPESSALD